MVLLVNQHTVPIFVDVANAFAESGEKTILFAGQIEVGGTPVSKRIKIVKSVAYNRKTTLTRLFTWLVFTIHYFFFLALCKRPDKILVVTNPPFAPFVTAWLSRIRRIRFFVLLYDLYPDALNQAGIMRENHWVFRRWKKMNYSLFARAQKLFTLSESMMTATRAYLPAGRNNIHVIHNWADTNYIKPLAKSSNPFIQNHNLADKTVVLYSGNMGLTHDLESLIDAAEIVSSHNSAVVFLLIGDGGKLDALKKRGQEKKLSNVKFLPYQSASEFPLAMASADIGVVTLGVGAEGISVPSKTYINLAAGAAILTIAPVDSELNRIVRAYDVGIVCEPGRPIAVANAIMRMACDRELLEHYKKNALTAAAEFTPKNARQYVSEMNYN